MNEESETVIKAVEQTLKQGYRTADIADAKTPKDKILNTQQMGKQIINQLESVSSKSAVTNI
jgi:3-isopropylmalate dehydrogenase